MPLLARARRYPLIALLALPIAAFVIILAFAGHSAITEAHAGQYLTFTGNGNDGSTDGYLYIPDSPALTTSSFTWEAWVFLNSYAPKNDSSGNCPTISGKGEDTSYWIGLCDGKIEYSLAGSPTSSDDAIPLGVWTHVAATFDGPTTTIAFYINGVADGGGNFGLDPGNAAYFNNDPLYIGSDIFFNNSPDGAIDEVRLWDVQCSALEVTADMNTSTVVPSTPDLVGAWNMEGNGNDASGNGHNGTLAGHAEFSSAPLGSGSATATASPTPSPTPTPSATGAVTGTPTPTGTTGTPTATPTTVPVTFTPTPTGASAQRKWGDGDCSGAVSPVDSLKTLKTDAGVAPPQTVAGCPAWGSNVNISGGEHEITVEWGDVDCNGSVNPVDSLKVLKTDAGVPPAQTVANCPALGSMVQVS